MPAIALLDRNGVYGAQRFSVAAREHGVRPIIGAELSMEDGSILPVLVENRTGYKNLCELLTQAHLRSEKGKCAVRWDELAEFADGLVAFLGSARLQRARAVCRHCALARHVFGAVRKQERSQSAGEAPALPRQSQTALNF